ncbi:hypothetical protein C0V70_13805 [Bacteriovorax stolpii]|uniref:Uncharacterized protein n=1 Tax=Bacteriovorax stolpii TaxID=960 RepID=A0A2K9NUK6_BACTC|nr:hypothetical protein [Bacteriovorax stolpii]AUN99157.1 hypothetical protein C0V70_13805 [Bacteriovorax stolpii]TDP55308.1 hypothetical protein C8D79_0355 [Bacteriovorax stolpii]
MRSKGIFAALLFTIAATACSSSSDMETAKATNKYEAQKYGEQKTTTPVSSTDAYYAVLEFDKGTQRLSEAGKRNLKNFINTAKKEGKPIDDIKILAWADKEYPNEKGARLSDRDVAMAKERSKSIEKYLKEDLKTEGDYATYNMAKRPNKVNEFFRGDDYKTKKVFGQPNAVPVGTELNAFMKDKAGKALIMVDYSEVE